LSEEVDAGSAIELLAHGSHGVGYILKDRVSDVRQLIDAIERVAGGESVIDPEVATRLAAPRREKNPLDELTERERGILELMAEGRSNQAISELLFLTPKTVEGHISHIFSKLGLEPTPDEHRRVVAVLTYLGSV
jgi:serine/threonine-protein kinase